MPGHSLNLKPMEAPKIMKNVIIISLAFMLHFTAYNGAANLQSSINAEAALETISLTSVYVGLILSSIFLPVLVIKWLGLKWTMCLGFVSNMPYIVVQLYPSFYTMIPAGLMLGLGAGLLWCAACTYLIVIAEVQHKESNISTEIIFVRFMEILFMIYNLNQVFGNLISSLLLNVSDNEAAVTRLNETMIPIICGADFLPNAYVDEALMAQPPEKIQLLSVILLSFMAAAALTVAIGVDSVERYKSSRQESAIGRSGMELFLVTFKLLREPAQLLMIAVTVFNGMELAFFAADFTSAFVSCAVGTGSVGFVTMTFGLFDAIGCILTGYMAKLIGRLPLMCVAFIIHGAVFCTLLIWHPHVGGNYVLYIIAALWGICDSIWLVQITVCYGILSSGDNEASFSLNQLWLSAGFIIAFVLSPYLRTSQKVYLLLGIMVIGMITYTAVEFQQLKIKKQKVIKKSSDDIEVYEDIAL